MIRLGISGYGNLGRGVEAAVMHNPDVELKVIFTRRDPAAIKPLTKGVKVDKAENASAYKDEIDVLILCGGSATDLPAQTPEFAKDFNVVDSFDTHANIPQHFEEVDKSAKANGKLALISCGWDPGMFSIARVYADSVLPGGETYTFWGKGVSQGHSDAIRRVKGVVDARQYTVPVQAALDAVRSGSNPALSTREKHTRECYVVAEEGADKAKPIFLLMSVGRCRAADERALAFLDRYAGENLYVLDGKEIGLNDLPDEVSEYFNHVLFSPVLNNVYMRALSKTTHKDYMTRRYMWKVEY